MFSLIRGVSCRIGTMLVVLGLAVSGSGAALAHEGHDHGGTPAPTAMTASARVTAQSENYELVSILRGDRLTLYLDRFGSNEPVTNAKIGISVAGDPETMAEAAPDGTYAVSSPRFSGEGTLEL